MSKHPEDWWTRTLLGQYGPRDRTDYDVLLAIDSFGDDHRTEYRTIPQIADRARIGKVDTVRDAIRRLEAGGWLLVTRPAAWGRSRRAGYLVNREPLIRAACEAIGMPVENTPESLPSMGGFAELEGTHQGGGLAEKAPPQWVLKPPLNGGAGDIGAVKEGAGRARDGATVDQDTPPPACRRHPNGYRHAENCGPCRKLREWDETRPAPTAAPERQWSQPWCHRDDPAEQVNCDPQRRTLTIAGVATNTPCPECHDDAPHQTSALVTFPGDTNSTASAVAAHLSGTGPALPAATATPLETARRNVQPQRVAAGGVSPYAIMDAIRKAAQ